MKKKLYVAMCLSLAMSLPGVVSAAQHQENMPSSHHGAAYVTLANTAYAVNSDSNDEDQTPHKWKDRVQQNNRQQYPEKDNVHHDGNKNQHNEDNDGNHYGNDKDNPGKHLGHDKDNPGKHKGHDQENYENRNGNDMYDNDKHDGYNKNNKDKNKDEIEIHKGQHKNNKN